MPELVEQPGILNQNASAAVVGQPRVNPLLLEVDVQVEVLVRRTGGKID
jgi:hypothetical protein